MFWQSLHQFIHSRLWQFLVAPVNAAQHLIPLTICLFVEPQFPEHVIEPDLPLDDKLATQILAVAFQHFCLLVDTDMGIVPGFLGVGLAKLFLELNSNYITQFIISSIKYSIKSRSDADLLQFSHELSCQCGILGLWLGSSHRYRCKCLRLEVSSNFHGFLVGITIDCQRKIVLLIAICVSSVVLAILFWFEGCGHW